MSHVIPLERIERAILLIRGQKVMLDTDLAALYEVETKNLVKAVKRNIERFPSHFMFQLTLKEVSSLRSQFVTPNNAPSAMSKPISLRFQIGTSKKDPAGRGGRRYLPYAFTEQGVAMLSSVLRSKRAIQVNIAIMDAFVRLREMLASHKDLARKLDELEQKYDKQFRIVFEAIRELMASPPEPSKPPIGFDTGN